MKVLQIVAGVSWETSFVAPLQLYGGYPAGTLMVSSKLDHKLDHFSSETPTFLVNSHEDPDLSSQLLDISTDDCHCE